MRLVVSMMVISKDVDKAESLFDVNTQEVT